MWSFVCDRGTARRAVCAVRRSDVFFSQTSRLPPAVSQPAETRSRQFTRTPYTSVILKISTSLSDTPTDADRAGNGNRTAEHVQTSHVHPAAVGASVVSGACRRWLPCPVRVRVGHRLGGPGCRGHIEWAASPAVG